MSARDVRTGARGNPPPRPTQIYDALILGGDFAGLVAGAVLVKRGFRVLHVDDGSDHPDRKEGGHLLPNRPDLLPPPRALPSLHALLDELGLMPNVGRSILPHPRGLQLLRPDARLDLLPKEEDRARELERAFGPQGPGWHRDLQALDLPVGPWLEAAALLPPAGIGEAWKLRGPIRKLLGFVADKEVSNPLMEAARDLHALLAPAPGSLVGLSRTIAPLLPLPSQLGPPRLWRVLHGYLASHRGETLEAKIAKVVVEKGGFGGVQFEGIGVPHRARVGIFALSPSRAAELVESRGPRKKLEALPFEPSARQVTLNLVLEDAGIPPGLGSLALVQLGGSPLLLSVEPARDEGGKELSGLHTLTATGNFPLRTGPEEAKAQIRSTLEEVVPFFDRHLRYESLHEGGPAEVEVGGKRPLGIEGLGPMGPMRRSLWASAYSLPGLGIEGRLLAGLRAARIAQEWLAKK